MDQPQQLISSICITLAHAEHVCSMSVTTIASNPAHRQKDRTNEWQNDRTT